MTHQSFRDAPAPACSLPLYQTCPHDQLEVMRQVVSAAYLQAAVSVRCWQNLVYQAQLERESTRNPFRKLSALFGELGARLELRSAKNYKAILLPQLPHDVIAAKLGWKSDRILPPCEYHQTRQLLAIRESVMLSENMLPEKTCAPQHACTCSHPPKHGVA